MKKKIAITVPAAVLLLALYVFIFSFSAQDGEVSGTLSQMLSEKCVDFLNHLSGGHWTEDFMGSLAEYFEHPLRKLAHFSEYTCMAVLLYVLWSQWMKKSRRLYLLILLWVFFSAAADEFHQWFVPGRYCSPWDVLLDTCGGAFGVLLCVLAAGIGKKGREN